MFQKLDLFSSSGGRVRGTYFVGHQNWYNYTYVHISDWLFSKGDNRKIHIENSESAHEDPKLRWKIENKFIKPNQQLNLDTSKWKKIKVYTTPAFHQHHLWNKNWASKWKSGRCPQGVLSYHTDHPYRLPASLLVWGRFPNRVLRADLWYFLYLLLLRISDILALSKPTLRLPA